MGCRINYNQQGNIESVNTLTGERSQLFDRLASIVGAPKALDLYALTQTEDFKQSQNIKKSQIVEANKQITTKDFMSLINSLGAVVSDRPGYYKYVGENTDIYFKSLGNKNIELALIETPVEKRGKGYAKKTLNSFVKNAGTKGFFITLTISPRDVSTKEKGLIKLYKDAGFYFFKTNFEMYRDPLKSDKEAIKDDYKSSDLIVLPLEPSVEDTINYASSSTNIVSVQEEIELQNTLSKESLTSYAQLTQMIGSNLTNEGLLVFTESSLRNSGLYNEYEIQYILNSIEVQDKLRDLYQRLKSSDNYTFDVSNEMFNVETSKINSLGKQEILNPFTVENEVVSIIAGKDLNVYLDDIPYDSIKNNYNNIPSFKTYLDNIASNNRNISHKKIENGEIVDRTSNNNRELFEKTLDLDSRDVLNPVIDYLNTISPNVWDNSLESIYKLLKDFNTKAIKSGIDFLNIEDTAYIKSREEILGFLEGFQDLLNNPSENNLDYFFDTYTDFFDVVEEPLKRTVETKNENNIYLETEESEYYLFDNFNLIKESENVYKEIRPVEDLEEAYNILFLNKDKIPAEIQSIEDLKSYINNLVNNYNNEDFEISPTQLESMIVHKIYFNSNINTEFIVDKESELKYSNFNGDYDYLTTAFASDFYKNYITEKRKNSVIYKNFYSNFEINDKGIVLKSNDPITISKVMFYVTEDLQNYNLISKNLNLPITLDFIKEDITEMEFNREYAISYPKSVQKLKSDFAVISPETIVVRDEVRPIIKTLNGLYELDYQTSNNSFYNKLPVGNSNFNSYGQYRTKTQSSVDVRSFSDLDTKPLEFIEAKDYYTKSELQEINKKYFNC